MVGVSDRGMQAAILLLVLILPLSSLIARRSPARTMLIYAGIWLALAAILFVIIRLFT